MKKLKMFALLFVGAVALAACGDDPKPNKENPDPTPTPVDTPIVEPTKTYETVKLNGAYSLGDHFNQGNHIFQVLFTSEDIAFSEDGKSITAGYALSVGITSEMIDKRAPKAGTYSYSLNFETNTFGGRISDTEGLSYKQTASGKTEITGGTVKIEDTNNGQKYTIDYTYADGTEGHYTFDGAITYKVNETAEEAAKYRYEPQDMTTINYSAVADSSFIVARGAIYGGSNGIFTLVLGNAKSEQLILEYLSDQDATSTNFAGGTGITFSVRSKAVVKTWLAGEIITNNGKSSVFGSRLAMPNSQAIYWLTGGTVDVTKSGDNYTVKGTIKSHYGSTINVNYTGALRFIDQTQPATTSNMPRLMPKRATMLTIPGMSLVAE